MHVRRCCFVCLAVLLAAPVFAGPKRSPTPPPTPPQVVFCDPLHDTGDPAFSIAKKLRLEAGARVSATQFLSAGDASRDRSRYLLLATQRVEGGFDSVNLYDRGVVSWGLMQWASHSNSLQEALGYVKARLLDKKKGKIWADLFKAQGLDVQIGPGGAPAFFVGGPLAWKPVVGVDDLRVLFRGTKHVGRYDPATVLRWGKVFARAGRNPVVQSLQVEWATRRLRDCLATPIDGRWRVADFSRGDLFSDALSFALWTNNPAAFRSHFARAVRNTRLVTGTGDPALWPPGLFPLLWEDTIRNSSFGTWRGRAQSVARTVPVGEIGRRTARVELASRGWRLDLLRRGAATGRPWRRLTPRELAVQKFSGIQATADGFLRPVPASVDLTAQGTATPAPK